MKNKVVIITGASRGLRKSKALAFEKEGARLSICARSEVGLLKVKQEAEALGAEVLAITADISNPRDVERFVATTENAYRQIDVLINNGII